MKLVPEWRRVLAISFSFWLNVAGVMVMVIPEVRYAMTGQDYNPFFVWWAGILLLVAGLIARLFRQGDSFIMEYLKILLIVSIILMLAIILGGRAFAKEPTLAQTMKVALPLIKQSEGKSNVAYKDMVGVWTICFGSTKGVRPGMIKSDQECNDLLKDEIAFYREGLHRFFTEKTLSMRLTANRDAAYTSTSYNCGIVAIGRSTATRRLNAGDIIGGCNALTWWNKAGGRVVRGLFERRKREKRLCLIGVSR